MGMPLRSGVPGSLRSMLLTLGEEHYHAWGSLIHSVKSGKPAFNGVYGSPLFEYLQSNSAAAATFNDAMTDFTRQAALACALAYDFSGIRSAVDIGGGHGALIATILRCYPLMTGVLFDSAAVLQDVVRKFKAGGIEDRCLAVPGDFFESIPPGSDAYLMKNVLHDWDDDSAVRILQNCRRALRHDSKLLVIEVVLGTTEDSFENLLDLNMLVMSGGHERTEVEYRRLFKNGGFELTKITPTAASLSVIEGLPSPMG
jgi:SAM-dependent methyltransferase